MAETGRIRRKRSRFAQVSNHCLQNNKLSLRAKGLYALIQSLIDIPDFILYKSKLQENYCNEGRDAFNKTWNELKDNGYLRVIQVPGDKGHFNYEYELLDEPEQSESNPGKDNSPYTEKPTTVQPYTVNPSSNNTKLNNTKRNNTNYSNDDGIDKTLNAVGETGKSVVVSNDTGPSSSLSSKEIREKVKSIMDSNIKDNASYNCFEDPAFSDGLEYDSTRRSLLDFAQYHGNPKDFPFYRLRDIASCWTRNAEICRNPDSIAKAEKMLLKVMGSFTKPAEKLAILSMETEDILYLLENLQKYYNPEEESTIVNPQTWTAGTIRPMISAKAHEISGAQI